MNENRRRVWTGVPLATVVMIAASLTTIAPGSSAPAWAQQPTGDTNVVSETDVAVVSTPNVVVGIADPIPVVVVQPPREPFQQNFSATLQHGDRGVSFQLGGTPHDKLKVIETITVCAELPAGQSVSVFNIHTLVNGEFANHWIPLFKQSSSKNTYVGAQQVRIYSDPSTAASVTFLRDSDEFGGTVQVSVSGHFEAPPAY